MKKLTSLFLSLALCVNTFSIAFAAGFTDVVSKDYCYIPILWAVENEITSGTTATTFSPNETCTIGQILTFLWRTSGQPISNINNPFTDVTDEDYFVSAACWAYEKGLVSDAVLNASAPCTRSMVVTYLWKLSGSTSASPVSFTDVSAEAEYAPAVAWAVEKGITSGTTSTTFSPNQPCTRGQIATFLYRFSGSPAVTSSTKNSVIGFYSSYPNVPDFGAFAGVFPVDSNIKEDAYYYFYSKKDILAKSSNNNFLADYEELLISNGFSYSTTYESSDGPLTIYSNNDIIISIGIKDDTVAILIRPLSDLLEITTSDGKYYKQCPNVPDFGAVAHVPPISISPRSDGWTYTYNADIPENVFAEYGKILNSEGFQVANVANNGYGSTFIELVKDNITILFGETNNSIMIAVYFN